MTKDTMDKDQVPARSRAALLRAFGSAWRRRRSQAKQSWRETVTLFKPEPWLVAVDHGKSRSPVKLRDQPEPSK
jgi:hypothetical protein